MGTGDGLLDALLERDGLEVRIQLPGIQIAQVLCILQRVVATNVLGMGVLQAPYGHTLLPVVGALLVFLDGGVEAFDYLFS